MQRVLRPDSRKYWRVKLSSKLFNLLHLLLVLLLLLQ
jgi:hypothetical protein